MRNFLKAFIIGILICGMLACVPGASTPQQPTAAPVETPAEPPVAEEIAIVTPEPATPIPTPTPSPIPTPTPTPEPTPEPTPDHLGVLDIAYLDQFSYDGVIDTDDAYRDATKSITVKKVTDDPRTGKSLTYFIVDIYLQNVEDLRRVQATDTALKGAKTPITSLSKQENAIIAMSGDHCTVKDKIFAVIDGEVVYDSKTYKRDLCVLYRDGVMATYSPDEINPDAILARGPWITWNFGPMLLDRNGEPKTKFNLPDHIGGRNPRAAIGYFEPGHYCLVLVDGRQFGYSMGLDIDELAVLMKELGCTAAYNLDGGISAQLTWHGKQINQQKDKRNICDIICISYPSSPTSDD